MISTTSRVLSQFTLRSVESSDEQSLFQIYASTRVEELAQVDWDAAQRESFLRMQFTAQTRYYHSEYPGAVFQVIWVEGAVAGRLSVHRRDQEIRIMDIALLPDFRRRGIGTQLIRTIQDEAVRDGKCVTIHVESFNPAQQLYERLGFRKVASNGVYHLMEYRIPPSAEVKS